MPFLFNAMMNFQLDRPRNPVGDGNRAKPNPWRKRRRDVGQAEKPRRGWKHYHSIFPTKQSYVGQAEKPRRGWKLKGLSTPLAVIRASWTGRETPSGMETFSVGSNASLSITFWLDRPRNPVGDGNKEIVLEQDTEQDQVGQAEKPRRGWKLVSLLLLSPK